MIRIFSIFFITLFLIFSLGNLVIAQENQSFHQDRSSKYKILDQSIGNIFFEPEILDSNYSGEILLVQKDVDISFFSDTTFDNPHIREDISVKIIYHEGIKISAVSKYENGQNREMSNFNNLGLHGIRKIWYKNGVIREFSLFSNDSLISSIVGWYNNGTLESTGFYNTINHSKYWHPSGVLSMETKGIGPNLKGYVRTVYNENGVLIRKSTNNCGTQKFFLYHENGQMKLDASIYNDRLYQVGNFREWNQDGILIQQGFFHDSIPNLRIKTWKYYNEKGELIKEEIYKEGELQETKEYLPLNVKKE